MTEQARAEAIAPAPWLAVKTLCWREIVRFVRQRDRVIGAVGTPVLFWLLFGTGLQGTFRLAAGGPSFAQYYFPGTIVLVVMFTAIFASISVIEDRSEGFLQSVLVAPIPRWSMVLGKVFGGASIALMQGLLLLFLGLFLNIEFSLRSFLEIVGLLAAAALWLNAVGLIFAWRMESTQGFHAIMNLLLMPMWLVSGAFFPIPVIGPETAWGQWLMHWCMVFNPLTYTVSGIRHALFPQISNAAMWMPAPWLCWTVSLLITMVTLTIAIKVVSGRTVGES